MKNLFLILPLFIISAIFAWAQENQPEQASPTPLKIIRITPEGNDVPSVKQIVIEFNRPVVPIGVMERKQDDIPITITPQANCNWIWLNTRSLACNLNEKDELKKATKYSITVKPGIKAEDGATIEKNHDHSFITLRPDVSYVSISKYLGPGTPEFRVYFTQPVTFDSVAKSIHVKPKDSSEKYSIDVKPDPHDNGRKTAWLISPRKELPPGSKAALILDHGLTAIDGKERSVQSRSLLEFATFPEFKILGVKCYDNNNHNLLITPDDKDVDTKLCNPLLPIRISFSSPVLYSQIKSHLKITSENGSDKDNKTAWEEREDYSRLNSTYYEGGTFDISLPSVGKANTSYTIRTVTEKPGFFKSVWNWLKSLFSAGVKYGIEDEFGRTLDKEVEITFRTDNRKPNFEIIHRKAVLEKNADSEVPLYVNNLESIKFNYRSLTASGAKQSQISEQKIPKVENIQFAIPMGIREMLGGKSGAVYGYLETSPDTGKGNRDKRLFAQVTPFQVQVKLGHFSTLVWVTDLTSGKPVEGAKITAYIGILNELPGAGNTLASATTNKDGIALMPGTVELDPKLKHSYIYDDKYSSIFFRVDKGGDIALLPITYDFEISSYSVSNYNVYEETVEKYGHISTWGTTAQGIYKAGDNIQYKVYVRNQNNRSLTNPPQDIEYTLQLEDPEGKTVKEEVVSFDEFGSFSGEFMTSESAPVGWYYFRLGYKQPGQQGFQNQLTPMRVLVSDFTPSPFKVSNEVNGKTFLPESEVEINTSAKLHSGGPYTDASARVTAILEPKYFSPSNSITEPFYFNSSSSDEEYYGSEQIFQKIDKLDEKGELNLKFKINSPHIIHGRLLFESAVQDDRGKYIASFSNADYFGVNRLVGLRIPEWANSVNKPAKIEYIVSDTKGQPAQGIGVTLTVEHEVVHAAKVKGAGNAYITNIVTNWEKVAECHGKSAGEASLCEFTPKKTGNYRAIATIEDTEGRNHSTKTSLWVTGKDYVQWNQESDYYLPITPEKQKYNIGDTARFMLKNPLPDSYALVTIERYGVLDSFIQKLDISAPVIEFPIKPDYMPGFYLSVTAVSPRVDKPLEIGQVDMGKPTFRMGYLKVDVTDKFKEIKVTAKTDRDVYKPREKVKLSLSAKSNASSEPVQYAVTVLDEAVFDLISGGESYYDPYKGFFSLKNLDLRNFSLMTRLVGRQKFEKKGANPGGDGGADLSMRDFFKFVSYWNPSIKADSSGNAEVEFEVPDNLTGWRVLAVAVTPTDRFGLGQGKFAVNRPTEIRPVMPNQVGEGDKFSAGFSVMNRTDQKREINFDIEVDGDIDTAKTKTVFRKKLTLEPNKRETVYFPVTASLIKQTRDINKGEIRFISHASDGMDSDLTTHKITVNKQRELVTAANYGTTTEDKVTESLKIPASIYPDIGEISVSLSPSVINNIDGAFRYMRDYPYICWEQQITKAVMASHYLGLKQYLPDNLQWEDAAELPQATINRAINFQAPNGGMTYFRSQDAYVDPYLSAYTALTFTWLEKSGYKIPKDVRDKLDSYLDNYLRTDASPEYYSNGMSSDVRAAILSELAERSKISLYELDRYKSHIDQMSLFGKTFYMDAAVKLGAKETATEVGKKILNYANESGGKFSFTQEISDSYNHILSTPLRENCAILGTFTRFSRSPAGEDFVGDIPFRLVRSIIQTRGNRDHWENTQENMFCMNALLEYSRKYENVKPDMVVSTSLNGGIFGEAQFMDYRDKPANIQTPLNESMAGDKANLDILRNGSGRLYYATRLTYSPKEPRREGINAGIDIRKEYSVERGGKWVLLETPAQLKKGELVRGDIYLSLPAARNFVVVNDPVPGGLEPLNRDIANTSIVDSGKGAFDKSGGSWYYKFSDWVNFDSSRWSFYRQEIRHDSVRFYSDYLPPGNYHLSYVAQAIAEGEFRTMPVFAEEMYDPNVYGKGVETVVEISPQD